MCFLLPSVPKKPASLKFLLDFKKYFMSFTNIYRIFQEKVSLFDVDISTQINTLDGMPKTS